MGGVGGTVSDALFLPRVECPRRARTGHDMS